MWDDAQTRRLAEQQTIASSGRVLADTTTYQYRPAGTVTRITDQLETGQTDTQCFTYDWDQRLAAAWTATDACQATPAAGSAATVGGPAPYWQSWTYGPTGDRASQTDHSLTGDATQDSVSTYTDGKQAGDTAHVHALASVSTHTPGAPQVDTDTTYTYDEAGNVHTRTTAAGTDTFTFGTQGKLSRLDRRRQYLPFGGSRTATSGWVGDRSFVGGEQDDATGLTNLGAREYDTSTGRFLTPDPILVPGEAESWNAYAYADNSPVTLSDPAGTRTEECGTGETVCTGDTRHKGDAAAKKAEKDSNGCNVNACSSWSKPMPSQATVQAEDEALAAEQAAATAEKTAAAAREQKEGLITRIVSLVGDLIGVNDAIACFTEGARDGLHQYSPHRGSLDEALQGGEGRLEGAEGLASRRAGRGRDQGCGRRSQGRRGHRRRETCGGGGVGGRG